MKYDFITSDKIKPQLNTDYFGKKVFAFWRLQSTNEFAYKLAHNGEQEGTLIIAEEQLKGRGRLKRKWYSIFGKGLWFSVILRPPAAASKPGIFPFLAGVSVAQAVENLYGITPQFKWPNDLFLNQKKFCGILSEVEFQNNHVSFIVLGMGINVNHSLDDFTPDIRGIATSLLIHSLHKTNRITLLVEILRLLEQHYLFALEYGFDLIIDNWKKRCPRIGQKIEIILDNNYYSGIFEDLDQDGGLLLRQKNGHLAKIVAGDFM